MKRYERQTAVKNTERQKVVASEILPAEFKENVSRECCCVESSVAQKVVAFPIKTPAIQPPGNNNNNYNYNNNVNNTDNIPL